MLYRKGANLNDKNKELLTPLHVAVDKSHYDVIDVLLKCRGTKVNALDSAGQTALHRAARDGNVQACRILLSYGADPHIVSLQGFTAAQLSTESVSKLLSEEPLNQAGAGWFYFVQNCQISFVIKIDFFFFCRSGVSIIGSFQSWRFGVGQKGGLGPSAHCQLSGSGWATFNPVTFRRRI